MKRMRTRTLVSLVLLTLTIVLSSLFLAYRYFTAGTSSPKEIGNGVTVMGRNLPGNLQATVTQIHAPYSSQLATNVSPTYRITPSGNLTSSLTIQLPLTNFVPGGSRVIVSTAEAPNGPWTPLIPVLSKDGKSVSVTVNRLSYFDVLWLDLSGILSNFKKYFLDALIPQIFQGANPPECQNENQARQNYNITSTSRKTVYWCFGVENGKRVLKVVNNQIYPLTMQHPGLTVTNVSPGPFLQNIEQIDASLRQEVLVLPGKEVDFSADLTTGKQGGIHTQWDAGSDMLVGLQVAIDSLETIFFFFGYKAVGALKAVEDILDKGKCLSAFRENVVTTSPNPMKFFAACLSPDNLEVAFDKAWASVINFVLTAGGILDYLAGSAYGLVNSFLMSDQYEIIITHLAPSACPPGPEMCLGTRTGDMVGDGTDQIGITYTRGSCDFLGCTFSNLTIHVVTASGGKIDYAVPPYPDPTPVPLTNPKFLGVTDMDGNGRVEIILTFSGCADGCNYYAYEYLNGQMQPMPFYGSTQGGDGLQQAFKCSVVNGVHQVTATYEFQVPGESHPAITYQADGKGGMRYVSEQNITSQQAQQEGLGTNCPGLS